MSDSTTPLTPPTIIDFANLDDAGFQKFYADKIEPCFAANEADRVAAVGTFKKRALIGGAVTLLIVAALAAFTHELMPPLIGLIMIGLIAYSIAVGPLTQVGQHVKLAYCKAIGDAMGAAYEMGDFQPPAFDRFEDLRLTPSYARSHFEDKFSGTYLGSAFDLYEGHLEQRHTDSKGRTYYSSVFRGQLIRMHFPREFLGVTIVRRDAGIFNALGGYKNLKKVGLEDPVFERAFEVWGSDQVEARYLLHPAFMQRLLDLETHLKGHKLRCAFQNGDLLVALEGENLFEPGDLFKPLIDVTRAKRIVDEIGSVVRVMDEVLTAQARRG